MVSAGRYLSHHKRVADDIEQLLNKFGRSGEVSGFWCIKGKYTSIMDCIARCEHYNYCHNTPPPIDREYNPDGNHPWRGDMALHFLMNDRPLGNKQDWIWLQHPETRRISRSVASQQLRMEEN